MTHEKNIEKNMEIGDEEFKYYEISELPLLYSIKLTGDRWKAGRCPYCGGALVKLEHPIEHKHCLGVCERNYV